MGAPGAWAAIGKRAAVVAVALSIVGAIFAPHLTGDFVWDDISLLRDNDSVRHSGHFVHLVTSPIEPGATIYRPLTMITFWVQARIHGMDVAPFRAVNIALHGAVAVALFAWLVRGGGSGSEDGGGLRVVPAALGTAFFAVHPSVTEAVMWLHGRHDTLGALFALIALQLRAPRDGAGTMLRHAASALVSALAVLCKETFVVLPLLFALDDARRALRGDRLGAARLVSLGPTAALIALVFALRRALGIAGGSLSGMDPSELLRSWATIVARYAIQLGTFRDGPTVETFVSGSASETALVLAAVVFGLSAAAALARRGMPAAASLFFGGAWFVIALGPAAIAIAIAAQYANRYVYFPAIGVAFTIATVADRLLARVGTPAVRHAVVATAGLGLVALAHRTSEGAARWSDEGRLFGADVRRLPDDGRALYHFAVYFQRMRGCEAALPLFQRATALAPGYGRAWHNVAGCLLRMDRFSEAVAPARRAVALDPHKSRRHYNLGAALARSGDPNGARASLVRALALEPAYVPAQRLLASLEARPPPSPAGGPPHD